MKRIMFVFLLIASLFAFCACGNETDAGVLQPAPAETPANENPTNTESSEVKTLVAYFSSAGNIATDEDASGNIGHGNTKFVAEIIQAQAGGDLFFIETADKYPANYRDAIGVAMQELRNNARPALASHVENMDEYDVIFLGYPNWWGTLPQAVLTFLEEYDFSGKTVIPFCTYEDSGIGRSIQDLENMLPDSTLLKVFSVSEENLKDAEDDVEQWLSELDWEK